MSENLTEKDIDVTIAPKLYTQKYSGKPLIDGVSTFQLKNFVGEDGDFSELMRLSSDGEIEGIPGFSVQQINRTKLYPGTIKGWHLHFKQDDVWYALPSSYVIVGLWDLRNSSKTKGAVMRIVLGGGESKLLFIPRGVAHGSVNISKKEAEVLYFVNQKFDINVPDEKRLPWDSLGADFWRPLKD